MNLTQQKALDIKSSFWVDASAGTGKTKILVDRVLSLLLSGASPKKILCLTFTNISAAEMSSRINRKLQQWSVMSDFDLKEELKQMFGNKYSDDIFFKAKRIFLELLDSSDFVKIQTIHSFCQMLVSKFPVEAGIMPDFTVIDETKSRELLEEAKIKLLTNITDNKTSPEVRRAINNISSNLHDISFTKVIEEVLNNSSKLEEMLGYDFSDYSVEGKTFEAIKLLYETFNLDVSKKSEDSVKEACSDKYINYENLFSAADKMIEKGKVSDIANGKIIKNWLSLSEEEKISSFDSEYVCAFLTQKHKSKARLITKKLGEDYPQLKSCLEAEQQRVLAVIEEMISFRMVELTSDLLHVCDAILILYKEAKKSQGLIDYKGLIAISVKLLSLEDIFPWILYKLDSGINHILIDEAQDTSPEQWFIIKKLCEGFFSEIASDKDKVPTLFVVGDEKQSIYSFQGANIEYFSKMRNFFKAKIIESKREWNNIQLEDSYRSVPVILKFADIIFNDEAVKASVSSRPEEIIHKSKRNSEAGRVEIWPIVSEEKESENNIYEPWSLPDSFSNDANLSDRKIALLVVKEIHDWFKNKRILLSKQREITPGDITILVRHRTSLISFLISELKKYKIPVAGLDRIVLKDYIAIQDIISLSNFILLPCDDLSLAEALKSPLFGISEEDLADLCIGRGEKTLWEELSEKRKEKNIYEEICVFIEDLFEKVAFMSAFDFFSYILIIKEKKKAFAGRLGEEVYDVIDEFLNVVTDYEKNEISSLQGFLHNFSLSNAEAKRDFDNETDHIRIMTIHAAKGLQAPIVFLLDTTSAPRSSGKIFWKYNAERKKHVMLLSLGIFDSNKDLIQLKEKFKKDMKDEYFRLLYVAVTRAEDELYVIGKKVTKKAGISSSFTSWYDILNENIKKMEEVQEKEGRLFVETNQYFEEDKLKTKETKEKNSQLPEMPKILLEKADKDTNQKKNIVPSGIIDKNESRSFFSNNEHIKLGNLIHKLFEILPSKDSSETKQCILSIKKIYSNYISEAKIDIVTDNVIKIINNQEFAFLFSKDSNSFSEVELAGNIRGRDILGKIDRIVFEEDKIIIVDYKYSGYKSENLADIENTEESYLYQMASYYVLLKDIYPDLKTICYLFFYKNAKLVKIPEVLLEKYANLL